MKGAIFIGSIVILAFLSVPLAAQDEPPDGRVASGRITPLIFPAFCESTQGQNLALGIADRAASALFATGSTNHIHLKQVFGLARSHHLTSEQLAAEKHALLAAKTLGATSVAFGRLEAGDAGRWQLDMTACNLQNDERRRIRLALSRDASVAVREGGAAIAEAIASLHGLRLNSLSPAHPDTQSGEAMEAYLACYRIIINQPMGLRKPHIIPPDLLIGAREKCLQAVKTDPQFAPAWAALGLVYSLGFRKEDAARALEKAREAEGFLALYHISRYWWSTRFEGSREGAQALQETVRRFPGALIFFGYLGEHLNITRQYDQALGAWDRYLERLPNNPLAMAQKGYSLARLSRLDESIDITSRACRLDPDNMELKLELASRLVDANRLERAESLLTPLVEDRHVFGEVLLRLGYVYLLKNENDRAETLFHRALAIARSPQEWRTRGRTRYDLAIVMARKGRIEEAEQQLLEAAREGFLVRGLLRDNADLRVLSRRPRVAHLFENPTLKRKKPLLFTTPFPLDTSGTIDPDAQRTPPPMTGISF